MIADACRAKWRVVEASHAFRESTGHVSAAADRLRRTELWAATQIFPAAPLRMTRESVGCQSKVFFAAIPEVPNTSAYCPPA